MNLETDHFTSQEYRRDSIVDRWVIIAKNRAARPNEYEAPQKARSNRPCSFCEGNELLTTPEIAAYRAVGTRPQEPGWRVRVVPNRYPALDGGGSAKGSRVDFAITPSSVDDLSRETDSHLLGRTPALGVHEVIIESPRHITSITELSDEEVGDILSIYRDRLLAIKQDPSVKCGLIFKNVGPAAGASIEHTHSQLVGLPMVPRGIAEELTASAAFYEKHCRCIFCDLAEHELAEKSRVVLDTAGFVAFCPFAARFPFETWLLPKHHASNFEQIASRDIVELAGVLRKCIEKIERTAGRSDYNYFIHSAPFDTRPQSHYHWHIEIFPRLTGIAGFEWGTGQFINPMPPEEAAERLRQQ